MSWILADEFFELDFDYKKPVLWRKILGLIYSPSKTLKLLSRIPDNRIPLINAFLIILFTSLPFTALLYHLNVTGSTIFVTTVNNYFLSSLLSVFLVNTLTLLFSWMVISAVYWAALRYFNTRISYAEIFKLTLQSLIPLIFSRVVLTFAAYLTLPTINIIEGQSLETVLTQISILFDSYTWIFYKFIDAGAWLWCALILSISFREYYDINFKKSLSVSYIIIGVYLIFIFIQ